MQIVLNNLHSRKPFNQHKPHASLQYARWSFFNQFPRVPVNLGTRRTRVARLTEEFPSSRGIPLVKK
nr:MAG TPA: hypothetical protein [Caudoviricetes sp.]